MQSKKYVIFNADDFGLHRSINLGVAEAHRNGLVTSASLMPGSKRSAEFEHALSLLTELPDLDVGLHFTLVGGPEQPKGYPAFMGEKLQGRFSSKTVESILRRQLDTLLENSVDVSHIDSHQHLHALPSIMRVVATVASEYGIFAVRLPCESGSYAKASFGRKLAAKVLAAISMLSKRELDRKGIQYTDRFSGMAISGHLSSTTLSRLLSDVAPGTTEILCHPGNDNAELSGLYDWRYDWRGELNAVTDSAVIRRAQELNIVPYTYRQLVAGARATSGR